MTKYIIANWKCNKNEGMVEEWVKAVADSGVVKKATNLTVVLCPSFLYLHQLHKRVEKLALGAQTVSAYANGAYTGAVSAEQVSQFAQFALLGHMERRKYFAEDNQTVVKQVREALRANLTPIIAVDEHNWVQQLTLFEALIPVRSEAP